MRFNFTRLSLAAAVFVAIGGCTATVQKHAPPIAALSAQEQTDWTARIMSNDLAVREAAENELIQGGEKSLPVLKFFLRSRIGEVREVALEIIRRQGPKALPLLAESLRDERVEMRREIISILIDLAPDTELIQPEIARAMQDPDLRVARDAARALGALGEKAAPSVSALVAVLSDRDEHMRSYAAEALASIGPAAAPATGELTRLLDDSVPGVRWAACEALASIGPQASPAVPKLIHVLGDEFLYVRICAAGALGSIGPKASVAIEPLRRAAQEAALSSEAHWAIEHITGIAEHSAATTAQGAVTAPTEIRPELAKTGNPPLDWDIHTGRNIAWSAQLGADSFGAPIVDGNIVYIGSSNSRKLNPAHPEECGTLMAFNSKTGDYLWQDLALRVKRGQGEFLLPSTSGTPYIQGDRLYYVTADAQFRCLEKISGKLIWELDIPATLGVYVHEAANSGVLPLGDMLIVSTSNGKNEGHTRVPSPRAPSLIAVDKKSGSVIWRAIGAGKDVLHGQWSTPSAANIGGRIQVLFGGGDGWLRAYDAGTGREIWRFDGNPKDSKYRPRPEIFSRSAIVHAPVFDGTRVYIAMGEDPSHGDGPSLLHAISPNGQGDVTQSRLLWTSKDVGRVVGPPIVQNGLLYVADLGGNIFCIDAATGITLWKHETDAQIWGCMTLVGGKLYVGNKLGKLVVLAAGRKKELLASIDMRDPLYAKPAVVGDSLYIATNRRLYLITRP